MLNLSKDQFIKRFSTEKVVSVHRKIVLDVATPVSVVHRFLEEDYFVFLESLCVLINMQKLILQRLLLKLEVQFHEGKLKVI